MYYEAVRLVVDEAFSKYDYCLNLNTDFAQKTLSAFAEAITRESPVAMPDAIEKAIEDSFALILDKDPGWASVPPVLTLIHTLKQVTGDEKMRYTTSYSDLCNEHWKNKCQQFFHEGKLGKNEN